MKPSASLFTFVLIPLVIQALPIPGGGASGTVAVGLAGQILSAIIANLPAIIQLVTTILSAGGAKPAGLISSNLALGPLLTPDIINGSLKVIQGAIDATEAAASAGTDQTAIIASALGVISNPTIINGAGQLLQGVTKAGQ
ncbi:hypothetical protein BDR26DRAFT_849649 [Obelidium mucronatum]|nr:hypothetical protein BDR26DRAFT_849649 [Obelidium mucronatum]